MDLFDLNKTRVGIINEEWNSLKLVYEFRSKPILNYKKRSAKRINKHTSFQGIRCKIVGKLDNKTLSLEIKTNDSNKSLLYQLILCFTYIVGRNISLYYYIDEFPYYPNKRDFNFNRQAWPGQIQTLILDPANILRKTRKLLLKEDSLFKKIVPLLEEINAFSYQQITFLIEFSLLERLANEKFTQKGKIFADNSAALKELQSFSDEAKKLIGKHPLINIDAIKNKITVSSLNSKGTTKDKINGFIDSFKIEGIIEYKQHVNSWNNIRRKLAHGSFSDQNFEQNVSVMRQVHNLLVDIVDLEFRGNYEKTK